MRRPVAAIDRHEGDEPDHPLRRVERRAIVDVGQTVAVVVRIANVSGAVVVEVQLRRVGVGGTVVVPVGDAVEVGVGELDGRRRFLQDPVLIVDPEIGQGGGRVESEILIELIVGDRAHLGAACGDERQVDGHREHP